MSSICLSFAQIEFSHVGKCEILDFSLLSVISLHHNSAEHVDSLLDKVGYSFGKVDGVSDWRFSCLDDLRYTHIITKGNNYTGISLTGPEIAKNVYEKLIDEIRSKSVTTPDFTGNTYVLVTALGTFTIFTSFNFGCTIIYVYTH